MGNKIAIASEGKTRESRISDRAGRAPYYLVFENRKLTEIIKNPFAFGGGGAGWSIAYMLAEKNIDMVIAGNLGFNMQTALKQKNIKYNESNKRVKEVVEE